MVRARFGSTYTKIGTIHRRLAWPLHRDDTQIHEAFHIFKKKRTNLQERWDYVKRPNLHLTGVPECDGENESKVENTLQDIIQENFPNLARQRNIQIQKIQRTP